MFFESEIRVRQKYVDLSIYDIMIIFVRELSY